MSGHTPGPWEVRTIDQSIGSIDSADGTAVAQAFEISWRDRNDGSEIRKANARLIAAAPTQHEEMMRFLPVIERAEADPELWAILTAGTGIATANAYRAAIAKATGAQP